MVSLEPGSVMLPRSFYIVHIRGCEDQLREHVLKVFKA